MSLLKFILPALAIAGSASAACSVAATTTIQNAGDASALATCTGTFQGSIAIATGTTDPISLDGPSTISGSLIVDGAPNMTSLSSKSVQKISQEFTLNNVQTLATLSFPSLTTVDTIRWQGLPNLGALDFASQVQMASVVDIQNTFLSSLKGINVQQAASIILANNLYLKSVDLQVGNISTGLQIGQNAPELTVSLPNLIWAQNLTFRNCPSVTLPSLSAVNGSLGFYENTLESVSCPNLTRVDGSLSFVSNTKLSNITFPELEKVGGALQVANNTELDAISFPALTSVGGALDFYGNFSSADLPKLNDVRGAFNMQSSGDISKVCDTYNSKHGGSNVIKGKYTCAGAQKNPGGAGTTPTSSGAKSSAKSVAAGLDVSSNAVMGLAGVVAAMLGLL